LGDDATRVVAVRHGETAWNADTRLQGQLDIPLNDTGRRQAARAGRALAHEGIDAIWSSDLARASETAEAIALAIAEATGKRLRVDCDRGLRERAFGFFEGHTYAEIDARWPGEALRWRRRDPSFAPDGGESLIDFHARCIGTATRLAARHAGCTLLLVAHGGVMDCLHRAALGLDLQAVRTWQLGNASINRLLFSGGRCSLVGWADTLHLDDMATIDEASDGAQEATAERPGRVGSIA
jgi:probable phosphoglycerate mutase